MTPILRLHVLALVASVAVLAGPGISAGQVPIDTNPGSSERTRAELEELLDLYDRVLESPAYSDGVKRTTRGRAERIRDRLSQGDFELGDRVVLDVQGEPQLPDTVPVQAGPRITLPLFGDISLRGVLRSEIEEHLAQSLAEFIHAPVVRAQALMRVSVQGAVAQPGFYVVPASMLLSEALMAAGGPEANSELEGMRIERGPQVVIEGRELQEALRQGLTLDQLNLQAGDQVVVPQDDGGFLNNVGVIAGLVGSLGFLIFQVVN